MNETHPSSPTPYESLSEAGQLRRDQMLPQMQSTMQNWHHRRRRNRRVTLAAVPLLAITAGATWWQLGRIPPVIPTSDQPTSPPSIAINIDPSESIVTPHQVLVVDRISTNPNILDRFKIEDHTSIEVIDDASLLALLEEMNRPTGLITTGGEVRLTHNVVDQPSTDAPSGS